jgi:hypothetical protein
MKQGLRGWGCAEGMTRNDENKIRRMIVSARKYSVISEEFKAQLFDFIDLDLGDCETSSYNASNLQEAICCYIDYGEYDVDSLINEIREAEILGVKE